MDNNRSHSRTRILALADEFLSDAGLRRYSPRTVETYRLAITDFDRFLRTRNIRRVQQSRRSSSRITGGTCTTETSRWPVRRPTFAPTIDSSIAWCRGSRSSRTLSRSMADPLHTQAHACAHGSRDAGRAVRAGRDHGVGIRTRPSWKWPTAPARD